MKRDEARIADLVTEGMPIAVWVGDAPGGRTLWVNDYFERLMGARAEDPGRAGELVGFNRVYDRVGRPLPAHETPFARAVATRNAVTAHDMVIHRDDGSRIHISAWARPIFADGQVSAVVVAFADMSALVKKHRLFEAAAPVAPLPMVREPFSVFDACDDPAERRALVEELRTHGKVEGREVWLRSRSGRRVRVSVHSVPFDLEGERCMVGAAMDVTRFRNAESSLRDALAQQEVLLNEVHHRVYNNLQIVNSMLSLQRRTVASAAERATLDEIQSRIATIGAVHEAIHGGGTPTCLPADAFVRRFLRRIRAGGDPGGQTMFDVDLEPFELPLDAAVPFGLALNEILSRAIRTTKERTSVRVRIELRRRDGGGCVLSVTRTSPEPQCAACPDLMGTLGMRLVRALVGQLDGRFELDCGVDGTSTYMVTFPIAGASA